MAYVAQGAYVSINGIDLSGVLKSVKVSGTADVMDASTLADTPARKFQKGLITHEVTGEGFFKASDTTAEDANGLLQTALTNLTGDFLMLVAPEGTTEGLPAQMANLKHTRYEVDEVVGELLMATFAGNTTKTDTAEEFQNGIVLFSDTVTGATNGATYDAGGSSTGWFLQIQMNAGDDTAQLILQHSTNGSVWADLYDIAGDVGNLAPDTAYQFSDTNDAVNRYLRLKVSGIAGTSNVIIAGLRLEYHG